MTIYMYTGSKWKNPGHHENSHQINPKPNQCPPERRAAATAPQYQPDFGNCGRSIRFQDFSVSVFSVFPRFKPIQANSRSTEKFPAVAAPIHQSNNPLIQQPINPTTH
jgi:hypothetical protein